MAIYDAQVIIPNGNGLAEDSVTNVWHFNIPTGAGETSPAWVLDAVGTGAQAGDERNVAAIAQRLSRFYGVATTEEPAKPSDFLSSAMAPAQTRIKVFNVSNPPPLVPLLDTAMPIPAPGSGTLIPHEVACVLSFAANRESGTVAARRRGRIYFGPLNFAGTLSAVGGPRVSVGLQRALLFGAGRLRRETGDSWVVVSRAAGSTQTLGADGKMRRTPGPRVVHTVNSAFVDNAFDTQRRRGPKATARLSDMNLSTAALDAAS